MDDPEFRRDLYRGAARHYDRFRLPYPSNLIDDLRARAEVGLGGRILDLACGTGQISFALHGYVDDVWAVDQESDMVEVGREKAKKLAVHNICFATSTAEDLVAPEAFFDLVAIGNAFQRLRRETVATNVLRWLGPGRYLALLWSQPPWHGEAPWQQAMSATFERWMTKAYARDRVPPGWEQARAQRPDRVVLERTGFDWVGTYEFPVAHRWTPETLMGFVLSTSFLSAAVLGDLAHEFEEELRRELASGDPTGQFLQTTTSRYELARRPA